MNGVSHEVKYELEQTDVTEVCVGIACSQTFVAYLSVIICIYLQ